MVTEAQFFLALRAISIHMIKHVQPIYKPLLPILKLHEDGQWNALPFDEQIAKLEELSRNLDDDSAITAYFAAYPHKWSRERFSTLKTNLNAYLRELQEDAPK